MFHTFKFRFEVISGKKIFKDMSSGRNNMSMNYFEVEDGKEGPKIFPKNTINFEKMKNPDMT